MKPSRQLDALIAEKIIGLKSCNDDSQVFDNELGYYMWHKDWSRCGHKPYTCFYKTSPEPYSSNIGCAWKIIDKMKDNDNKSTSYGYAWNVELIYMASDKGPDESWSCILHGPNNYQEGLASTAPLAICLAALKAMEVKLENLNDN